MDSNNLLDNILCILRIQSDQVAAGDADKIRTLLNEFANDVRAEQENTGMKQWSSLVSGMRNIIVS